MGHAEQRRCAAENELPAIDKPEQLAELLGVTIPQLKGWRTPRRCDELALRALHDPEAATAPSAGSGHRRSDSRQHSCWILHNIVERLPVHGSPQGFLVGRSILSNAAGSREPENPAEDGHQRVLPDGDVEVPAKGVFRAPGIATASAHYSRSICTELPREIVNVEGRTTTSRSARGALPQGAPTSPALTNALRLRLDRRLAGLAKKYALHAVRRRPHIQLAAGSRPPKTGAMMGW